MGSYGSSMPQQQDFGYGGSGSSQSSYGYASGSAMPGGAPGLAQMPMYSQQPQDAALASARNAAFGRAPLGSEGARANRGYHPY
jgi:hypothetical protein